MKVAIASDHRGADALTQLGLMLREQGCELLEFGGHDGQTCDYPDMAYPVANAVSAGDAERGVLICGSGIGMCIAANKVRRVRAALVHDEIGAEMSRRHNDANVLCLPADLIGMRLMERVVQTWLRSEFEGGRHARRVAKITAIEDGRNPLEVTDDAVASSG